MRNFRGTTESGQAVVQPMSKSAGCQDLKFVGSVQMGADSSEEDE